jgi:PAS domain S-box-containing protein
MRILSRRALYLSAAAPLLGAALFAALAALRADSPLEGLAAAWPYLILVALLTWGTALAAAWAVRRCYRRALRDVTRRLAEYRLDPSADALVLPPDDPLIETLGEQVELLTAAYRKAIADLVSQGESLESLRAVVVCEDGEKRDGRAVVVQRVGGSSRNMVARVTPNLHWIAATPALQKLLGRPIAELNARPLAEVVHPDDLPTLRRGFQEANETGEAHNITFRLRCRPADQAPDATPDLADAPEPPVHERHVQMDVVTRYADDTPLHFRCFLVDVTDRVTTEHELRRRTEELSQTNARLVRINQDLERLKESYRDLYHNAPVMYFSLDVQGRLFGFNDPFCQTLGYARKDLHMQPYTRLLPPESRQRYAADPEAYQHRSEVETRWLKKDGTVIDVWIRSVPQQDAEGRFVRSRSVAQDVTERNRLADELRRRGDELERANAELRQTNQELDEFTFVVSHDLNEPLNTFDLYSNILAEDYSDRLGPDGFEAINHLVTASRRQRRQINDLLTLSRAGRVVTAPRPFHLAEAVATVRRDLGDLFARKEASLHTEGSLPVVVADPDRVAQLLANLAANGLKYNKSAGPRVVIGEVRRPGPEGEAGFVTLFVRDNGIGIDPRFHQEIFRIFRRLHREEFEGTGAGLAICKRIVEAHGGRIWVESEPGQGATFYFTLPRAPAGAVPPAGTLPQRSSSKLKAAAAGNGKPAEPAAAPHAGARLPGARLLLVEDMADIQLIVQRLTQHSGYSLKWVASAEEGWEYLQAHRPDLVLLDVHLPGMDGIELCRKLRAVPELADLPVALFSQGANPDDIAAGRQAGANYVLPKDLLWRPEDWRRRVEEMLHARPQPAEAR